MYLRQSELGTSAGSFLLLGKTAEHILARLENIHRLWFSSNTFLACRQHGFFNHMHYKLPSVTGHIRTTGHE